MVLDRNEIRRNIIELRSRAVESISPTYDIMGYFCPIKKEVVNLHLNRADWIEKWNEAKKFYAPSSNPFFILGEHRASVDEYAFNHIIKVIEDLLVQMNIFLSFMDESEPQTEEFSPVDVIGSDGVEDTEPPPELEDDIPEEPSKKLVDGVDLDELGA